MRIFPFLVLFVSITNAEDIAFSEVYTGGGFVCVDTVFEKGDEISILDLESGKISKATVVKDTQYQDLEVEISFPTMIINTEIKQDLNSNRYIAVNSKVTSFEVMSLDYKECKLAETFIPGSNISMALSRDVGCKNYEKNGLDSSFCQKAKLYNYELIKSQIRGLKSGPRFIFIKKKCEILHSPCVIERERAFKLNGVLYIYSGSGGCECGSYGIELHSISDEGIKLIYSSWKWSL